MKLSILDLIPVFTGQTSSQAVAATLAVAEVADRLGYQRYWFAEHHNMPSVASTSPAVTAAAAAGRTERIRIGSGGVMLPNHSPFVVAEQFAMLEAVAPGRIDLGIGRAPGSDPVVTALLRTSGPTSDVEQFPRHIANIQALLARDGAELQLAGGKEYAVRATPVATLRPPVWLLGSSDYSAGLAARMGLAYVFANHFSGPGIERAMHIYRSNFQPSEYLDAPQTFLTVNASVADSADEARARATPQLQQMSRLRTGKPLTQLDFVEDALDRELDAMQRTAIDEMVPTWIIGDGPSAAAEIRRQAEQFGVDEVMVQLSVGQRRDESLDRAPAREHAIELLAAELLDG